jgi:hypothetical protein
MKHFFFAFLFLFLAFTAFAGTRRVRHLTLSPKAVGASLGFDSRAIRGLEDGALISQWTDLSENSRHLTGLGANRPTYKINIVSGQPVVRFDENDGMTGVWNTTITSETVLMVFKSSSASILNANYARFFTQTDGDKDYNSSANFIPLIRSIFGIASLNSHKTGQGFFSTLSNTGNWITLSSVHTGTAVTNFLNSTASSSDASTVNKLITRFGIGVTSLADGNASLENVSGDFALIFAFDRSLSPALRRRLTQAAAFSFKIKQ